MHEFVAGGALDITGVDQQGEARIVELKKHYFFVATLFLPQLSSFPEMPHPLIMAYLRAAMAFHELRSGDEK